MTLMLHSTEQMVEVNGVPARVWAGHTADGIAVQALVTRIAVRNADDQSQFEAELANSHAPAPEPRAFPLRMVL